MLVKIQSIKDFQTMSSQIFLILGFWFAVSEDGDCPVHAHPTRVLAMLESWVSFSQDPELRRVDHRRMIQNTRSTSAVDRM